MTIAHGKYKIDIQGNIICVKLTGAFNELGATNFTVAMKKVISTFDGKAFSILIDDLEVDGGTLEAYAVLEDYNQWLNSKQMTAKAMIINSPVTLAIIEKYAPARKQQNIAIFDNQSDAFCWLKTQEKSN
jgi:hypothetical protein